MFYLSKNLFFTPNMNFEKIEWGLNYKTLAILVRNISVIEEDVKKFPCFVDKYPK